MAGQATTAEFQEWLARRADRAAGREAIETPRARRFEGPVTRRKKIARARIAAEPLRQSADVLEVVAKVFLRTVNGCNERAYWTVKSKRAARERDITRFTLAGDGAMPTLPWMVTLTRISPGTRKMDFDGLTAALKHVRDEVAACAGVDDGNEAMIRFAYEQTRDKPHSVCVRIAHAAGNP